MAAKTPGVLKEIAERTMTVLLKRIDETYSNTVIFKSSKVGRGVSVILDKNSGQLVSVGYSGKGEPIPGLDELPDELLELVRELPYDADLGGYSINGNWIAQNCVECKALVKALNQVSGSTTSDFAIYTAKLQESIKSIRQGGSPIPFERCDNCKVTTGDATILSDY